MTEHSGTQLFAISLHQVLLLLLFLIIIITIITIIMSLL